MAAAYSIADLVVCRSGATTLSELSIMGIPAILVPLPSASNNEQYHNACYFSDNNAAVIINDNDIDKELLSSIDRLLSNKTLLSNMKSASKNLANIEASKNISKEITDAILKRINN